MAQQIKRAQENMLTLIRRIIRRTIAVSVSCVVLFVSFFHAHPDYRLMQHGAKAPVFGIQHALADGDSGGDGDDDDDDDDDDGDSGGDDDAGGDSSGDSGDGSAGDSGGDSEDDGDSGGDSVADGDSGGDSEIDGDSGGDSDGGDDASGDSGDDDDGGLVGDGGDDVPGDGDAGDDAGDSDSGDDDGGGDGGGGLNQPSTSLSHGVPEQPLAFVTLSQIPYTGFSAGWLLTGLYWLLLTLWSAALAYFMIVRKFPLRLVRASRETFLNTFEEKEDPASLELVEELSPSEEAFFHPGIEDREATDTLVLQQEPTGAMPRLELKRTATRPAASDAMERAAQFDTVTRMNEKIAAHGGEASAQTITEFIKSVASGKTEATLEALQAFRARRESLSEVLVGALCEIDRVYCRRFGDQEPLSDESIEDIFENWSNEDLQALIQVLSTGLDRQHASPETGAKMALLRAVEFAKRKRLAGGTRP